MYHGDRNENAKPSFIKKLFGIVLVLGVATLLIRVVESKYSSSVISPVPDEKKKTIPAIVDIFSKKKSPEEFRKKVQETVNNRLRNYSVYVKDLGSPFAMGINETVIFTAASVNKVPIVAALYYYAGKGEIDLDERVTIQAADVQDFGSGSIRYDPPGSVYAIKTLAKLAIEQSDNTAGYVLGTYTIGLDKIQSLMTQWGLTQTDMVNNKTSNHDMGVLFEKMYKGEVTNPASTKEMLAFFKDTDFEDRLPALLPKNTSVYHKIGNEIAVMHDVGIVTDGKATYYIGVFSNDITDEEEAKKIIAEISKLVYDYFKQ
ncbi:serine hydrolase [Candidatus Gottesmanbacteria bacterium]|nr:serine hydrolase [Candidatus Gottesmanbacteria bacterium]